MIDDRYWSKVAVSGPDECWIWKAGRSPNGYGVFWDEGKNHRAHRLSLEDAVGPPPDKDSFALHSCDNPPCVNPAHLRWGTAQDNVDDRLERTGDMKGENSPTAILTTKDVETIYSMRLEGIGYKRIAETLNLPFGAVEQAYTGNSWKHLLGVNGNPTLEELRAVRAKPEGAPYNKILTDKIADRIFQARMEGMRIPEIAKELGLPKGTIASTFCGLEFTHRLGVDGNPTFDELRAVKAPHPRQKLMDEDIDEIRALLKAGYTGASIARKFNISRATVSNINKGRR